MEEQKYCIKHKLSNGTYLAILNNGWRYDGSFIVEADSELELNAKLNEARYDDRWVTMEGNHVLIGGNGRIKAGAGGRLKGRKFGMRFSDYDHGRAAKNGKRLIRQYTITGKKAGEKRIIGGSKKKSATQITKPEEIGSALTKAGFQFVDASFRTRVDKKLAVENANQLLALEHKFGVAKATKVGLTTQQMSAYAAVTSSIFNAETQKILVSTEHFNNRDKLINRHKMESVPNSKGQPFKMPCAEDKYSVYSITHEYGHALQNMLITRKFKADGWSAENAEKFRDINGAREYMKRYNYFTSAAQKAIFEVECKWYLDRRREVINQCRNEIIAIAKKNDKNFKLKDNISEYGGKVTDAGKAEFFAEVFANSQLGAPNELGIAMQQWLKQKGLVQNE